MPFDVADNSVAVLGDDVACGTLVDTEFLECGPRGVELQGTVELAAFDRARDTFAHGALEHAEIVGQAHEYFGVAVIDRAKLPCAVTPFGIELDAGERCHTERHLGIIHRRRRRRTDIKGSSE